jgi:hypothetical protein
MSSSVFECEGTENNREVLIVSFGGLGMMMSGIPPFEFLKSLNEWFPQYDKKFIIDIHQCWYHKGIGGLSSNIEETKVVLEKLIEGYKKVIFIGVSAGGYAAILLGSLCKVTNVVAFSPQTLLSKPVIQKYRNLCGFIHSTTVYSLYGDPLVDEKTDPLHHIYHLQNIEAFPNVHVVYKPSMNLREMRDNGELLQILQSIILSSSISST